MKNVPFESLGVRFLPCRMASSTTPGPIRGGKGGRKEGGVGGKRGRTIKTCNLHVHVNTRGVWTITFIGILCLPRIQHFRNFLHLLKRERSNVQCVKLLLHWCHSSSLPPTLPPFTGVTAVMHAYRLLGPSLF